MNKPIKILRAGVEVGAIDRSTGKLTSSDRELIALYQSWEKVGFKVLGPPPQEAPAGVFADALYTVHPRPDNLGLVVIELENHGYGLSFDETPPAADAQPEATGPQRFYGRPADRSLEAYKAWMKQTTAAVGGSAVDDPVRDREEVWERDWREFWARVDAASQE